MKPPGTPPAHSGARSPGWYSWPVQPFNLRRRDTAMVYWDGEAWSPYVYASGATYSMANYRSTILTGFVGVTVLTAIIGLIGLFLAFMLMVSFWGNGANALTSPGGITLSLLALALCPFGAFAIFYGLRARKHLRSLPF